MSNSTDDAGEDLEQVTFRIPSAQLERLDDAIDGSPRFVSRSEAIRNAVGDLIDKHE